MAYKCKDCEHQLMEVQVKGVRAYCAKGHWEASSTIDRVNQQVTEAMKNSTNCKDYTQSDYEY